MRRNSEFDVLRVMLMFGICMIHAVAQAGHNAPWVANMFLWCVPGFVFISGWFGIRFSVGKILKLYGISLYCAAMYCGLDALLCGKWPVFGAFVLRVWNITVGPWFLNAYAVLMCFAPLLNEACASVAGKWMQDRRGAFAVLIPLVLCAFGWSFATTLPVISVYTPRPIALTAYSFLTLIGVYVVARIMRELDGRSALPVFRRRSLFAVGGICLVAASIGLGDYNSPFALVLAGCAFQLARTLHMPEKLGALFIWLAPSMFSVYLIHSHGQAWGYLAAIEDALLAHGLPLPLAYVMTAACVFAVCVVLDMPRRFLAGIIARMCKR